MARQIVSGVVVMAFVFTVATAPAQIQKDEQPLDKEFLVKALISSNAEIKASEIAQNRTANPKVKEYAITLVKDHTSLNASLNHAATDTKTAILVGTEKQTKDMLDRLSQFSGTEFDRNYLQTMIDGHQSAIRMFEAQSMQGRDAKLKDLASTALPTLRSHLKQATALRAEVIGK